MNIKRLLIGIAFLALVAGFFLAGFVPGGWFNRPKEFAFERTLLNDVSVKLGFVPDQGNFLPITGLALMIAGAVGMVLGWALLGRHSNHQVPVAGNSNGGEPRQEASDQFFR